jgi:hypothetical protein
MLKLHVKLAAAVALVIAGSALAADPAQITWKKITLTEQFHAEGANYADFNKDGKLDVVVGPWWYEGPDFTKKHQIYAPTGKLPDKSYDPHGYSDNFLTYCYDFNGDGYPDVLVYPFRRLHQPRRQRRWRVEEGHCLRFRRQ